MANAMRRMAEYLGLSDGGDGYTAYQDSAPHEESSRVAAPVARIDSTPSYTPSFSTASYIAPTDASVVEATVDVVAQAPAMQRITTLHPRTYNDARRIGQEFRDGTPVILNLGEMDVEASRRIVDFSAGLVFGLRGSIERVTKTVYLLSPANVDAGAAARAQLREDAFFNQS